MKINKKRLYYGIAFLIFFAVELFIALYVRDNFIRPYVGDVLVVILVYCFARIFLPEGVKLLPLYVFLFAAGVELMQYFNIVKILGLESNRILRTMIGSVADWHDVACYGVGALILVLFQYLAYKRIKNTENSESQEK